MGIMKITLSKWTFKLECQVHTRRKVERWGQGQWLFVDFLNFFLFPRPQWATVAVVLLSQTAAGIIQSVPFCLMPTGVRQRASQSDMKC